MIQCVAGTKQRAVYIVQVFHGVRDRDRFNRTSGPRREAPDPTMHYTFELSNQCPVITKT